MSMAACFVRLGAPCNMIGNEVQGFREYMRNLTGTFGGKFVIIMTCCCEDVARVHPLRTARCR